MTNCSLCQSKVAEKDNFCRFCGAKLHDEVLLKQ